MTRARRRFFMLLSVAIAALALAACGSDENTEQEPQGEIEDQLGFSQEGIVERQAQVENRIRDCMKAQGFDYVPVDPQAQRAAITGRARMSEDEFQEQFGYGISTFLGRGGAQSDPNERIRNSLSSADRSAYDRALFGDNVGLTFAEAVDNDRTAELGGCTKQATEAVLGGAAVVTEIQGKLDELDERIAQDQRMVRAIEKWSACMRDQGFQYEEPEEIDEELLERFQEVVGVGTRPGATAPADAGTSYDRAALTTLQRDEVRVAKADLACEKREIQPVEEEVRPQYEETFRNQNQRLLERVKPVGGEQ